MPELKSDLVLDLRHESGRNLYLVKSRHTGEIAWTQESNLPKGIDEQLSAVRKLKGEFAKQRVFGDQGTRTYSRQVRFNESVKSAPDEGDTESSSSGSESSGSDAEREKLSKQLANQEGKDTESIGGIASPDETTSGIISFAVTHAGCRASSLVSTLSDEDRKLNALFVKLLYGTATTSTWHMKVLDLLWTLVITGTESDERKLALEQLCLISNRLSSNDSIVVKSIDELLSDTTVEEIDSRKFETLVKLCDLISSNEGPSSDETLGSEDANMESSPEDIPHITGQEVNTNRFSYLGPTETELDNEGIIELVYKIYNLKNPEKLNDVPGIIDKYRAQLPVLFSTLMKKYGVDYSELKDARIFVPIEVKGRKLKNRLTEIFTVFEPCRIGFVDEIVNKFIDLPTSEVADYIEKLEKSYQKAFGASAITNRPHKDEFGFRQLVREALAIGNPEKVSHIESMLTKYSGREHFLYLGICDKYSVPVSEDRLKVAMELRERSVEQARKAKMRQVLTEVYEKYNKDKVGDVGKLVEKFNVLELFDLVAKKYGMALSEKIEYLLSTGVHMEADVEFSPLIVDTVSALASVLELERRNQFIQRKISPRFLRPLFNVLTQPVTSAEMVIQAKSSLYAAHGSTGSIPGGTQVESQFRDLIESKVTDVMRSLPVSSVRAQVTSQEPEYAIPDAFGAVETGRCSCVVSLKAETGDQLMVIINALTERLASQEVRQPTGAGAEPIVDDSGLVVGPGSVRATTILHSSESTAIVGDYRALQITGKCPSLFRNRLAVWELPADASFTDIIMTRIMHRGASIGKCSIIMSEPNLVAVVGSQKHRMAFHKCCALVKQVADQHDPSFSMYVAKSLCLGGKPGMVLPPQIHEWSDVTYHESGDDVISDNQAASETVRPLKLTRQTMRDAYLQGLLCMNCDDTTHKPPECPIKRKVCWNCHGAHAGASCVLPCRFCKGRHSWGILECVKRGAKRYADWVRSRSFAEEKGLGSMVDDVIGRLRVNGWNMTDPAIVGTVKSLTRMGVFVELYVDLAKLDDETNGTGAAGVIPGMSSEMRPVIPVEQAPPLPDSNFAWMERIWLDEILPSSLIGRDPMRLITSQKGKAIKELEIDTNSKITFKGTSAKEIFGSASTEPSIDVRFHAIIMAESPEHGLLVKKSLYEILQDLEAGLEDGTIPRPTVVEGFAYLEKVAALNDNIAQFDFMNVNGGAPIEMELRNHFELIGDLRHWLHQKGVEVELGDADSVKLPSSGKVIDTVDSLNRLDVDSTFMDVFNAFFELVSFWANVPPCSGGQYWFEPYELRPAGLLGLADEGADHASFESGQVVFLSKHGISHFSRLLTQCGFVNASCEEIEGVLSSLKGVVRTGARDNRLLMYLRHPWSLSSSVGTVARDVAEDFDAESPFATVLNPIQLRACGRQGHSDANCDILSDDPEIIRSMIAPYNDESNHNIDLSQLIPGDGLLKRLSLDSAVPEGEAPYSGYIVDWVTPQEVTDFVSGFATIGIPMEDAVLPEVEPIMDGGDAHMGVQEPSQSGFAVQGQEDLDALTVVELRDRLKAKDLPTTGRKADLIERIKADIAAVAPAKIYKGRVELPRVLMKWSELANNLSGPGNSHFAHIKQMCPSANISCVGTPAAALVGEARLHVQLTSNDATEYTKAKSLVEDLVKAVVEVGLEVSSPEDNQLSKEEILKEVRVVDIVKP